MPVRIVTDSSADIPRSLSESLGISVVPLTVNFGAERFRDGVDLGHEEFYQRLETSTVFPTTSQPAPSQFAEAYSGLESADIVSIHVPEELSGTINSARQAARDSAGGRRIEVIDSRSTSMGMGLVVLQAARLAKTGATLDEIIDATRLEIARSAVWFTVDTLEFLARGGRIGRAKHLLGTVLRIKPLLTVRNGAVEPVAQLRTRAQVTEALVRCAEDRQPLSALSVAYSTGAEAAGALADRLADRGIFPRDQILLTRLGPAIGTHVGPGCLSVALIGRQPSQ